MSASYKRMQISDAIGYHSITDPKFKTNTIRVYFMLPLDPQWAAGYALAASLLSTSTRKYPSIAALNRKMNRLYGAGISADVSKIGDFQIITLTISALANRYALEQEDILGEMLTVLTDCLFEPHLEQDAFSSTEYAIKVKDLLDTIDAEINNKRSYTLRQCARLAYKGEPVAYTCYGNREDVLALTPQSTYAAYQNLLKTAAIEVFFVGPEEQPRIAPVLSEAFAKSHRTPVTIQSFITPSPIKAEPVWQTEQMPVAQCKMALAFKSSCSDYRTMNLMCMLYGATPFSMLFSNVREKLSLCYYCSSSYSETKQTLFVDCGVEKCNIETAKEEILRQLKAVQEGDFTDELLENTRMSIFNSIQSNGNTPGSYMKWYFTDRIRGTVTSMEDAIAAYKAITREQIMEAARSLTLDTIYIMEAAEEEATVNG